MDHKLEDAYREIELGIQLYELKCPEIRSIWGQLHQRIRDESLSKSVAPEEYEELYWHANEFLSDIESAFNFGAQNDDSARPPRWFHRRLDLKREPRDLLDVTLGVDQEMILDCVTRYLNSPSYQHDWLDWLFLDSLIYLELAVYADEIASGFATGNVRHAYILAAGDLKKAEWLETKSELIVYGFRYGLPLVVLATLLIIGEIEAATVLGIVYAGYLVFRALLWPRRFWKKRNEEKATREHAERLGKMLAAYYYLKPPIIHLETLNNALQAAAKDGVLFDASVYALADQQRYKSQHILSPYLKLKEAG